MIDLHCHILPGVDDGAENMEESLEMAKLAVEEGITHILATPHHKAHGWYNEKKELNLLVGEVQKAIDTEEIPLTLFPGQEVRLYGELIEDINEGKIQFIDEEEQYLLIEFPSTSIPAYTERIFYELQTMKITPIIVHPERNRAIQKHPNILKRLVDKGALSQLTAGSYTGQFGKDVKKLSRKLLLANLVHYIASDAHNTEDRLFHMNELSMIFDRLDIDTREVLEAAGTKWNFLPFTPGLVGGHCIGVDPYYLTYKAEQTGYHPQVILSGRRINDNMGHYVVTNIIKKMISANISIKGARVGIIGFTFKENTPDTRNTRVIDIYRELQDYGIEPVISDEVADAKEALEEYGLEFVSMDEMKDLDVVIVAVAHDENKDLDVKDFNKLYTKNSDQEKVFIDVKSLYSREDFKNEGYIYWSL